MTTVPPSPSQGETAGVSEERWQVPLWDAINAYVIACGGDPSKYVYGNTSRMKAVAVVNGVVRQQLAEMRGAVQEAVRILGTGGDRKSDRAVAAYHVLAALAPTSPDPVRSAGEAVPERGKCVSAGCTREALPDAMLCQEHGYALPSALRGEDCAQPSRGKLACSRHPELTKDCDGCYEVWRKRMEVLDCAQPERQVIGDNMAEVLDHDQRKQTRARKVLVIDDAPYNLRHSPPQDDIVAGLRIESEAGRKIATGRGIGMYCGTTEGEMRAHMVSMANALDRAIAALGEKGAKRRKERCPHGVHQDNTCTRCDP
jgi:hypothetical protein